MYSDSDKKHLYVSGHKPLCHPFRDGKRKKCEKGKKKMMMKKKKGSKEGRQTIRFRERTRNFNLFMYLTLSSAQVAKLIQFFKG